MLTVLSVGYSLAPVGADAVGGSEQVLAALDAALVRAGHRSIVVACAGSRVLGELVQTIPFPPAVVDATVRLEAEAATAAAVAAVVRQERLDLVHMHGLDFHAALPPRGPATLVTLHLPCGWYPKEAISARRPNTWFHCVSDTQHATCPPDAPMLPPIGNGVPIDELSLARHAKRGFALMLARICPEKGVHIALQAARAANAPLLIGGEIFPYPEHQAYFEDHVGPLLDGSRRFLGPVAFARKRRLLAAARCLLVPSLAPETSSLVAMEALACGTPVIAYPAGALVEIVEHGRTGFLVSDAAQMAEAILLAGEIDPEACRAAARKRFSADRMAAEYLCRYQIMAARAVA